MMEKKFQGKCFHILKKHLWWACGCRSKWVPWTNNSLNSSGMLFWVSSFVLNTFNVLFLSDTFSKGALIPMCSPRSELAMTLVASRSEDVFIDFNAISILEATILPIAVKIAFCILSLTVSTILLISLSIILLKHPSKVFTFSVFSLVIKILPDLLTVNSWSAVPSLTTSFSCLSLTALPIKISRSNSSNWLRTLVLDCFLLRAETIFASKVQLCWKW